MVSWERVEVLVGKGPKRFQKQSFRESGRWDTDFNCTGGRSLLVVSKVCVAEKLMISIRSIFRIWGSINFLKIRSQFLITSGVPALRMRFFKAADHMKDKEIVSSYSPENPGSTYNGWKDQIIELTNFIICRDALEYTNELLKRESVEKTAGRY